MILVQYMMLQYFVTNNITVQMFLGHFQVFFGYLQDVIEANPEFQSLHD